MRPRYIWTEFVLSRQSVQLVLEVKNYELQIQFVSGVNKKPKNSNCLAWISDNLKTVWQGESGALKTVCWFFKYSPLDFINVFLR